jgi:hypothetical protein
MTVVIVDMRQLDQRLRQPEPCELRITGTTQGGLVRPFLQFLDRLEFGVAPEDMSDGLGFCVVEDELAVFGVVAERGLANRWTASMSR